MEHTNPNHWVSLVARKDNGSKFKEVKDYNDSGESTMNSMGIKMNQNSRLPSIKRILAAKMQEKRDKTLLLL